MLSPFCFVYFSKQRKKDLSVFLKSVAVVQKSSEIAPMDLLL